MFTTAGVTAFAMSVNPFAGSAATVVAAADPEAGSGAND
jgi:hypothetical protein